MIPKIIHYCWFGDANKEKYLSKYTKKWENKLDGYQIIEWNEQNFDLNNSPCFVQEAYRMKKYAFVSDYVRLYALNQIGGIYLDTDIEIIKNFDDILENDFFIGFENEIYLATCVIGAEKGNPLIQYFMSFYDNRHFINEDGSLNTHTNTKIITKMLQDRGVTLDIQNSSISTEDGKIVIFSREYFSPYDYINGKSYQNEKTYTVHHFEQSWLPSSLVLRRKAKIQVIKFLGEDIEYRIERIIKKLWR